MNLFKSVGVPVLVALSATVLSGCSSGPGAGDIKAALMSPTRPANFIILGEIRDVTDVKCAEIATPPSHSCSFTVVFASGTASPLSGRMQQVNGAWRIVN